MDPDQGSGNFLTKKIFGLPVLAWVAGIGLIAYYFISKNQGASTAGGSSSAGTGTASSSGTTTLDSGAITISVDGGQPSAPTTSKTVSNTKSVQVVATGKQDLQAIAVANNETEANIALWNKPLDKYIGTGKLLPKGTKVWV